MTKLIIVRHAQSIANRDRTFIGHIDLDLTELGVKQAELTTQYLIEQNYPIDVIYSSDLLRPYHTIEPYAKAVGKEIVKDRELREIYAGKWEGHKFEDLPNLFPESFNLWRTDISKTHCEDGESVEELYARINHAINRIAKENDGKCVLIGTHATPIRCLCARAECVGLAGMKEIGWVNNASVSIFEYDGGVLIPIEINHHEHLKSLDTALPKNV